MENIINKLKKQAEEHERFIELQQDKNGKSVKLLWLIWNTPNTADRTYELYVVAKAEASGSILAFLSLEDSWFYLSYAVGLLSNPEIVPGLLLRITTDKNGSISNVELGYSELEEQEREEIAKAFLRELKSAYESGKKKTWDKAFKAFYSLFEDDDFELPNF